MRRGLGLALIASLSLSGLALELQGPGVLLSHEPLIVQTEAGEAPPVIQGLEGGIPVAVPWQRIPLAEGTIEWIADLAGLLPPGPWKVVSDRGQCGFLVLAPLWTLVEVVAPGDPLVRMVTASGQAFAGRAVSAKPAVFLIPPPYSQEEAWIGIEDFGGHSLTFPQRIVLTPNTRQRVFLPNFFVRLTSGQVKPGGEIRLGMSWVEGIFSAVAELLVNPQGLVEITPPPGWEVEYLPQTECCGSDLEFHPLLRILVPSTASLGEYPLKVTIRRPEDPATAYRLEWRVSVVEAFSPREVIGHWDTRKNRVDWTKPPAITYERLLWASSLMGQPIPDTAAVMTPELWQELAEEWANSSAQKGED